MENNICQTCLSKNRRLVPQKSLRALLQDVNIFQVKETGGICWECHHMLKKFAKFKTQVKHAQKVLTYSKVQTKTLSLLATDTKNYYDFEFTFTDPLIDIEKFELTDPLTDIEKVKIEVKQEITQSDEESHNADDDDDKSLVLKYKESTDNLQDDEHGTFSIDGDDCNDTKHLNNDQNDSVVKIVITGKVSNESNINNEEHDVKSKTNKSVEKRIKKRQSKSKVLDEDLIDVKSKYKKVVFTIEEIMKNREEKRNRPNFKKLPFKCDMCVLGFLRKDTFDQHMETKHTETAGPYICDLCQMRLPNLTLMARHWRRHMEVFRCLLCRSQTAQAWAARSHCRARHPRDRLGRIHCAHCQWLASSPDEMRDHVKAEHSLRCDQCGDKFSQRNTLRKHKRRIHVGRGAWSCGVCGRACASKERLQAHAARHDTALARRLKHCAECNVTYKNVHVYRSHLKNSANHAERSYKCPECDKTFVSKQYWNTHYTFYHLKKSKHKCDMCDKIFISDWQMKNHKQIKHGLSRPRQHACNVCGKTFFTLATLRGHQYTHSEQRRFMCEDCGDTFKQRPALYNHTRLVHHATQKERKKTVNPEKESVKTPFEPMKTLFNP